MTQPLPSRRGDVAGRLDRLPASAVRRIVLLISLGSVFEFYDLFFTAYVAPGMVNSSLFTADSLGIFAALQSVRVAGFGTFVFSTFAGLWVGVVLLGHAADRWGRRAVFTWSLIWYAACTGIMAFQRSGQSLNAWRFVAGIGFGVQLITIDTYIVELVPPALRGRAFCFNQFISFCVVPLVALLAWLLVPLKPWGFDGWRWVVLLGSSGAFAVWGLRAGIPESPRWLASKGRLDEADAILSRLEQNGCSDAGLLPARGGPAAIGPPADATLREIFDGRFRGRTIMLSVFNAAQVIGFYGFNSWVPTLLMARGIGLTRGLEYGFIIALAQPVGPLAGAFFADALERKTQIMGGLLCMGVAMGVFALATSPLVLVSMGVAFTLAANVMSYAYHGYQAELFPTRIRSRAIGFVYSWSRLAAAFAGLIVGALLAAGGVPAVAVFIGAAMTVGFLVIGLFGPATRGVPLEEASEDRRRA
jgi:putative MFS transporter